MAWMPHEALRPRYTENGPADLADLADLDALDAPKAGDWPSL